MWKFILCFFISTHSFAGEVYLNDKWTGKDKMYHLTSGLVISGSVTAYTKNTNYGIIAGCGSGVLKEIYDSHRPDATSSFQDAAVTCFGAVIGAKLVDGLYLTPNSVTFSKSF